MKVKTSVTLSPELLEAIDRCAARGSRSDFLEKAAWEAVWRSERARRDARDVPILNALAADCSTESSDLLDYQAPWWTLGDAFTDDDFVNAAR